VRANAHIAPLLRLSNARTKRWEIAGSPRGSRARPTRARGSAARGQSAKGGAETFGGVDLYGNTKDELYERAKKLGVEGRSKMSKTELARAIARKQR
jgi:Rho termination factor, N-terminal domain